MKKVTQLDEVRRIWEELPYLLVDSVSSLHMVNTVGIFTAVVHVQYTKNIVWKRLTDTFLSKSFRHHRTVYPALRKCTVSYSRNIFQNSSDWVITVHVVEYHG